MPLVNPYCSVADIRAELADDSAKLSEALIEKAVNAASRAVDSYCGRRFWKDAAPVARDFEVCDPCRLRVSDIAATTGLAVASDTGDGLFSTTWLAADYQLRPLSADADGGAYSWREIAPVGGRVFPLSHLGRPSVRVTAVWGWSEIPDQVVEATILKAVALFRRKDAPFGVASFSEFGPIRITRTDPDVIELLAPFRRVVFA